MTRTRVPLLLLALLAFAPATAAADTIEKAFKKQAKFVVKVVKSNVKFAVKTSKASLKSASKAYAAGTSSASDAIGAALSEITFQRDELEDGSRNGLANLSQDGQNLLTEAGAVAPGPDFQAGGQGAWDDAQADIEAAMDKADEQLRKAFAKFVKDMGKAAAQQEALIDIRAVLPDHGSTLYSVIPPAGVPVESLVDGAGLGTDPPQILIAVRLVETNQTSLAALGVRASSVTVNVLGATTDGDEAVVGQFALDAFGTGAGLAVLDAMDHAQGFLTLHLFDGVSESLPVALSAPRITPAPGGVDQHLEHFEGSLKDARKQLSKEASAALKELSQLLASHVAAVKKGQAAPELALRNGWDNLHAVRFGLGLAWQDFVESVTEVQGHLVIGGFDDADLPAGFFPDGAGPGTGLLAASLELQDDHDTAARAYDSFVKKILALAEKQGLAVGANVLTGRTVAPQPPRISTLVNPPVLFDFVPTLTDGLALVLKPGLTEQHSLLLIVQADPAQFPSLDTTVTTLPDLVTSDLTELTIQPGGTEQAEVPLVADPPLLGWLFRTKDTALDKQSTLILVKPSLVSVPEP